ncbi:MAG: hypothetical protein KJ922_06380, partial [Nanoarchaeota archaeon]|nr:hypothetical protein [Nanoarchaeota archaeon]
PAVEEVSLVCEAFNVKIKTNSSFETELNLDEDGFYTITVNATDVAGNTNKVLYQTYLDTQPPKIEIVEPSNGIEIFENHADDVRIRGVTKPNSKVYLYVDRFPNGPFNESVKLSGFPDEIQDIPEAKLDPECSCISGANYITYSDAAGEFEFDSVDITAMWGGMLRIDNIPNYADFINTNRRDTSQYRDNPSVNLVFVAVDNLGRKGGEIVNYKLATCWSGNFSWDVIPLTEYQSPTFLSTERMAEGTEYLYFYYNFSYYGDGQAAAVSDLSVSYACDESIEGDERFNISCGIMPKSCTAKLNPSGTTAYVICKLKRFEDMDRWWGDDWNDFFDAINSQMVFPLKLRLTYGYKVDGKDHSDVQEFCESVTYVVDNARIDPREVLPDWLLYDAVDWLNTSITTLNKVLEKLDKVLRFAAIGCAISFIVKFAVQIYRRYTCTFEDFTRKSSIFSLGNTEGQKKCTDCLVKNKAIAVGGDAKSLKQDQIPDQCLKDCAPSCASAWDAESNMYTAFRWTCDRVFGHSAPSRWTEKLEDKELYDKKNEGSGCNNDQSMYGQPIRAKKCSVVEQDKPPEVQFQKYTTGQDCWEVKVNPGDPIAPYVYFNPTQVKDNIYKFSKIERGRKDSIQGGPPYIFALKQTESTYLTAQNKKCSEICGLDDKTGTEKKLTQDQVEKGTYEDTKDYWACIPAKVCGEINTKVDPNAKPDETKNVKSDRRGYTVDCFYADSNDFYYTAVPGSGGVQIRSALPANKKNDATVVSDDEALRYECCCINPKKPEPKEFYQNTGDVPSREKPEQGATKWEDMVYSYRYDQIGYVVPELGKDDKGVEINKGTKNQYNPDRYIKERDQPACFGQNQWLMDGFSGPGTGKTGNLMRLDPAKDWLATFQCVSLSHIIARLRLIVNIMNALRNCLLEVRTTGRADSGVCKELFTQYVCSFIWQIITWIRDGCLPWGEGIDIGEGGGFGETLKVGVQSVTESVSSTQGELAKEYGNAKLTNLFGTGQESIARKICLAAFGYDWEIG